MIISSFYEGIRMLSDKDTSSSSSVAKGAMSLDTQNNEQTKQLSNNNLRMSSSNDDISKLSTGDIIPSRSAHEVNRPVMTFEDPIIEEYVEKWRKTIAEFLSSQSNLLSLPEISSRIPTPSFIPRSLKLIDVLKFDPENRFFISGEGSNIKIKLNFKLSDQDIETLQNQWRDQISKYLGSQSSAIGLSDIGASVSKPFYLPTTIKLLETLQTDPLNRFVLSGEGNNMRARRVFRVDEEEILQYVDEWRDLIAQFLSFQKVPATLSDIGSSVARPPNLPTSVKLVEVLKLDPANRFAMIGDGNYIRAHLRNKRGVASAGHHARPGDFLATDMSAGGVYQNVPRPEYYYDEADSTGFSQSTYSGLPPRQSSSSFYGPPGQQVQRFSITSTSHAPLTQRALSRSTDHAHASSHAQRSLSRSADYNFNTGISQRTPGHSNDYMVGTQPPRPIARSSEYPYTSTHPRPISRSSDFPISNLSQRFITRSSESQWTGSQSSLNETSSEIGGDLYEPTINNDPYSLPTELYRSSRLVLDGMDTFGVPGQRITNAQNSPFTNISGTTTSMGSHTRRENDFEASLLNAIGFTSQSTAIVDPLRFSAIIGPSSPEKRIILQQQQKLKQKQLQPQQKVFTTSTHEDDTLWRVPRASETGNESDWTPSFGLFSGLTNPIEKTSSDPNLVTKGLSSPFQLDELRHVLPPPGLNFGIAKSSRLSSEYSNTPKSDDTPRLDDLIASSLPVDEEGGSNAVILRVRSIASSQHTFGSESTPEERKSLGSLYDNYTSDQVLLSTWLPQLFEGFPRDQIESFIEKLRDNGGFVTVHDLKTAQVNSQLTLELLQEVAEFKLGHYNRLINGLGLAAFN